MNNLFTDSDPRDRLLEALDPQGQIDAGRAVTIAHEMAGDTATAPKGTKALWPAGPAATSLHDPRERTRPRGAALSAVPTDPR